MKLSNATSFALHNNDHGKEQQYSRKEGLGILRGLPTAARHSLRYYEMVALTQPFHPLPPLLGRNVGKQSFVQVAITDWSCFLLSKSASSSEDVLIEIPWLWVKDLGHEAVDSDELLQPINERRYNAYVITVVPQVSRFDKVIVTLNGVVTCNLDVTVGAFVSFSLRQKLIHD